MNPVRLGDAAEAAPSLDSMVARGPSGACVCGAPWRGDRAACVRCGRLAVERRVDDSDHGAAAVRSPRRRPIVPFLCFLLVVAGVFYHFGRDRERPWEEMPPQRSRPAGQTVVWPLRLDALDVNTRLWVELKHLKRRWASGGREHLRPLTVTAKVHARSGEPSAPAPLEIELTDVALLRETADGTTVEIGLPVLERTVVVPDPMTRNLQTLLSSPLRQGDANAAAVDSRRFLALRPLGDRDLRAWVGYAVRYVFHTSFRIDLRGGGLIEGDPFSAEVRRFLAPVIPRGDAIERVRARLSGEILAYHARGGPFRVLAAIEFEVRARRGDAGRYYLTGELVALHRDWLRNARSRR